MEFADYRNYTIGDDLRFIDWNIYARLDKLFLKLFLEEEDLSLYILVDVSKSCDYGDAQQGAIPQAGGGRPGVHRAGELQPRVDLRHGRRRRRRDRRHARPAARCPDDRLRQQARSRAARATSPTPAGASPCSTGTRASASSSATSSSRKDSRAGLRYVAGGKYDLFCVQVLSPQELEPDLQGDLKLRDMEDDDMAEVSITQPLIKQYKANLNAYCLSLKDYITRRGGTYLFTSTAVPFDTLVLNYLRERGLLG